MIYRYHIYKFLHFLLLSTFVNCNGDYVNNVSIKLRTLKDLEAWRYMQLQAKQDYFFRKRVMNHPIICEEPIFCEESFLSGSQKEKLLEILNQRRNFLAQKSCKRESVLQLIWFWKAEINATIDSLGCREGSNQTEVIIDGDLNTTKYFRKATGFEIHAGEETFLNSTENATHWFPIRERLQCYTELRQYHLDIASIDYFLKIFENETKNQYNNNCTICIPEEIPYKECIYVGCSLTMTDGKGPNETNAYFNCYYCHRNITNMVFTPGLFKCPVGTRKSKEYSHLCQDPDIKNSFIDELITRQYDCGRLDYSRGDAHSKLNMLLLIYLSFLKIFIV